MGQEASGSRTNDTGRPFSGAKVPKRITCVTLERRKLQQKILPAADGFDGRRLLVERRCVCGTMRVAPPRSTSAHAARRRRPSSSRRARATTAEAPATAFRTVLKPPVYTRSRFCT